MNRFCARLERSEQGLKMGIYYDRAEDLRETTKRLMAKLLSTQASLEQLQETEGLFSKSTSGDACFDVELTASLNIARAGLLRLQAMLVEQLTVTSKVCPLDLAVTSHHGSLIVVTCNDNIAQ